MSKSPSNETSADIKIVVMKFSSQKTLDLAKINKCIEQVLNSENVDSSLNSVETVTKITKKTPKKSKNTTPRPVGRPRKVVIELPTKRPVGRPRKSVTEAIKKNPVGRPRKKRPVGRPPKKNPVGRPRKEKTEIKRDILGRTK